jgi:NDP-sugar pyrophosphorylase family protein
MITKMTKEATGGTPFIISSSEYFDKKGAHQPTTEQLEFLGRLAQTRGRNFKFSGKELEEIKALEEAIRGGVAVLIAGVAMAEVAIADSNAELLSEKADYGAALFGRRVFVGDRATVGDEAKVGDRAKVGDGAKVGDWVNVIRRVIIHQGAVIPNHAVVVTNDTNVIQFPSA